MALRYPQAR